MTATVHDMTIARLADMHPQACKSGFASVIRKVFTDYGDGVGPAPFIPDLFWFDEGDGRECDSGAITCIEVEDQNPISGRKLRAYAALWFALDSVGCDLRLLTTDRWGSKLTPIPLVEYWIAERDSKNGKGR
jgi:hypothetical protein